MIEFTSTAVKTATTTPQEKLYESIFQVISEEKFKQKYDLTNLFLTQFNKNHNHVHNLPKEIKDIIKNSPVKRTYIKKKLR